MPSSYDLEKTMAFDVLSQILADNVQDNDQNHTTGTFLAKRM
jgi:hypothetical protein